MTSSLDLSDKSMVNEDMSKEEEEIQSPMPLAFYDPGRRIHVSLQPAFNINPNQVEQFNYYGRGERLRSSTKVHEEIGFFSMNEKDVEEITDSDELFRASPGFNRYQNNWVPLFLRLQGWRIETRCRNRSGIIEKFYYHTHLSRQLRSKKQVYNYLRYGFVHHNGAYN